MSLWTFALRDADVYSPETEPDEASRSWQERLGHKIAPLVGLRRFLACGVETTRLNVQVKNLPKALEGFCIAHVSDFHVGDGMWTPVEAAEAAELVHAARPDVVVNTGDYLQEEPPIEKVGHVASRFLLGQHPAVSGPANLAVLGNHDYYAGDENVAELSAHLESLGVCMLVNRGACVVSRSQGVSFVGLTDDAPGFDGAVAALLSSARPRIALVHEPDLAERLPPGCADLVLAGHTHGGQITLPGMKPFITRRFAKSNYVEGLYRINEMPVYVNRGLGCSGLPIRFRARPEVALIRLVR